MNESFATRWKQAAPRSTTLAGRTRSLIRNVILSVSSEISRKQDDNYLRCIYCHYVFDDQKEEFESLITNLIDIGQFVDTQTCIQILNSSRAIENKYFHLSFDDGFRNNFTNAVPILTKHKVPAIFFVPSSLVEANWTDTRNYCLNTTRYKGVIEMLKWSDLREMISMGFEIGSHTKTHARFSAISNDYTLLNNEISGSKSEIEAKTKHECKYISWPYGRLTDTDSKSLEIVRNAGYEACFGAYRGTVSPGKTDVFSIPRHHFEVQWPLSHIIYFTKGNMEVKA